MKRLLVATALLLVSRPVLAGGAHTVRGSKHDFSVNGPGSVRATSERNPCVFCHISHSGGAKTLDNRPDNPNRHTPYESTTMAAPKREPADASRVCLSCHDGTIAVGRTRTRSIEMVGGDSRIPRGSRSNLGTDLRGTHPVSIPVMPSARLHPPRASDAVKLDHSGNVQCTSCHDPHDEWKDPDVGMFLVKPSADSALCTSCHTPGGETGASSTHLTSRAVATETTRRALAARATAGSTGGSGSCSSCHDQHGADARGRLLKASTPGDKLCLGCHGADSALPIERELAKASSHAIDTRGRHDAGEGPNAPESRRLPEGSVGSPRHSSCMDCHEPHSSSPSPAAAPRAAGALAGEWGIDIAGRRVAPAQYEYEICLKCHGDSSNKPQEASTLGPRRRTPDANLRKVFSPYALSFHPVAAPGRSASVPGLKAPLTTASMILCTDCHNNDGGPGAGGTGPAGPHGSIYSPLLERQYLTADLTPESPEAYALCYKCHERSTLLSASSNFPKHAAHVTGARSGKPTPCSACHAAHGVSADAAFDGKGAHLVSFDLAIVQRSKTGQLGYDAGAAGHGSCNLSCHGVDHAARSY